jgi:hypothetical protein
MYWFNIVFPLVMILFPAVFMTLARPNHQADVDLARAGRLTLWLWLATLGAVGLWAVAYVAIAPRAALFLWPLFFPLFFGFFGPLMRAKNPDWVSMPPPDLPVRGASLTPRLSQPATPTWSIAMIWAVWGAFFAAVLVILDWSVLRSGDPALFTRRSLGWIGLAISGGIVLLVPLATLCIRRDRGEPQTLDPEGSKELIDLYARRRRQRAWMFVGGALTMILLQGSISIAMALISRGVLPEQQTGVALGWAGGIAGSIVGVAGGILGTMSTIQAARINACLRELTSSASDSVT